MNLGSFVGAADYEGLGLLNGFGGGGFGSQGAVDALNKALATNANIGADGSPLIPQSLETTLKTVTYKMKEIQLWPMIAKRAAYAIAEEFNQLREYGFSENPFIQEGALPATDDSEYARLVGQVKFLGTTRAVTHPMTMVRTVGIESAIDKEDTNGTIHLLRLLELNLFYGDARLNALSFDGLRRIIMRDSPRTIIDLRGKPITDKVLESIDEKIARNWGEIDVLFMSLSAKANLTRNLLPADQKRLILPASGTDTALGMTVGKYQGNNSEFSLRGHKFIREWVRPKTALPAVIAARVGGRPAQPTATAANAAAGTFNKLDAGNYIYAVSAVNDFGEGLVSVSAVQVATGAGQINTVTWNQVQGARYYRVYRTRVGETALYLLDEIADSGQATTSYEDRGLYIPGTSLAFGLYMDGDQGFSWKQLAPLMKLPLAQIDTSMRWCILLYGLLQVYQPKKQCILLNVGSTGMPAQPEAEEDEALAAFVVNA